MNPQLWFLVALFVSVGGSSCKKRDDPDCACKGDDAPSFCTWWSAKHDRVEEMGVGCIGQVSQTTFRREDLLEYIAYFRTHAHLEDPYMWGLLRNCSHWTEQHEREMQTNERDEAEIGEGLDLLEKQLGVHCKSHVCESNRDLYNTFLNVSTLIKAHIRKEEELLTRWNLFGRCAMDSRWSTLMEQTTADANVMYEEFRKVDLRLSHILRFVSSLVTDWPKGSELRSRTIRRMRQVRLELATRTATPIGRDVLAQFDIASLQEYVRWLQFEREEGLTFSVPQELGVHMTLLGALVSQQSRNVVAMPIIACAAVVASRLLRRV